MVMTSLLLEFNTYEPERKLTRNEGHLVLFLTQNIPGYQAKAHYTNAINLVN